MGASTKRFSLSERILALALFRRRPSRSHFSGRWASLLALGLAWMAGCQKGVSPDELGTPVFKANELPGAGTSYERAEMSPPSVGVGQPPGEPMPPPSEAGPE